MMDEVEQQVGKAKKEWDEAYVKWVEQIKAIESYGKFNSTESSEKDSLPRMNGDAQDCLALLNSLQFMLDVLAPQLPTDDQVQSAKSSLESWTNRSQSLRFGLRNANLQAKANMRKAAQEESDHDPTKLSVPRELLLGGGEESTVCRTKAGMTSATENTTESLRRTHQLMVQEVERTASVLMTNDYAEESTGVLTKAESEYKGHRSLLMRTRNLLSTMQRQDVLDRIRLVNGFFFFSCAVLYVVSKLIGLLKLQRAVTAAVKSGMVRQVEHRPGAVIEGINHTQQVQDNAINRLEVPLERVVRDEL